MSVETGVVALLWKPATWLVGGLLTILSALLGVLWNDHKKEVSNNKQAIEKVDKRLTDEFYSREHIDLMVHPMKDSLDKNTKAVEQLNILMAKVETVLKGMK